MKVRDLVPGMKVNLGIEQATFIAQTQHPIWFTLQLVIWRMRDGRWSHDALSPLQDVGEAVPSTPYEREQNLRAALIGEGDGS